MNGNARVGGRSSASFERLRFRISTSIAFPSAGIEAIRWIDGRASRPPRIELTTTFIGLTGTLSPLPPSCPEDVLSSDDTHPHLLEFMDNFHHHLLSLLFRSWLRYRHLNACEEGGRDLLSRALLELIDVLPETPIEAVASSRPGSCSVSGCC